MTAEWRRLVAEAIANGARCVDCGTDRNLEGDHELPVSRGGLSTRANLSIRCRKHNRAKGNRVTRYQLRVPWPVTPSGGTSGTARPAALRDPASVKYTYKGLGDDPNDGPHTSRADRVSEVPYGDRGRRHR